MEHVLHNAEVVVYYEIMNSCVPFMYIQEDWYRPCNTNQRIISLDSLRARRDLFSWHDFERKYTVLACWNWMVYL